MIGGSFSQRREGEQRTQRFMTSGSHRLNVLRAICKCCSITKRKKTTKPQKTEFLCGFTEKQERLFIGNKKRIYTIPCSAATIFLILLPAFSCATGNPGIGLP